MIIVCSQCKTESAGKEWASGGDVAEDGITQMYIACPACQHRQFTHRENVAIVKIRQSIERARVIYRRNPTNRRLKKVRQLEEKLKHAFDAVN